MRHIIYMPHISGNKFITNELFDKCIAITERLFNQLEYIYYFLNTQNFYRMLYFKCNFYKEIENLTINKSNIVSPLNSYFSLL